MADAVEDAIDHYPAAAEIKIVKHAPEAAPDDKEKPDDAAISDFEAALKGKEAKPPAPGTQPETPPTPAAPETQPSPSP